MRRPMLRVPNFDSLPDKQMNSRSNGQKLDPQDEKDLAVIG